MNTLKKDERRKEEEYDKGISFVLNGLNGHSC